MKEKIKNKKTKYNDKTEDTQVKIIVLITAVLIMGLVIMFMLTMCEWHITKIEITNEDVKISESFGKYAVVELDENGEAYYQIEYKAYPKNVENKKVKFLYDNSNPCVVSEDGLVKFSGEGSVTVTVVPEDGSELKEEAKIFIIVRRKS